MTRLRWLGWFTLFVAAATSAAWTLILAVVELRTGEFAIAAAEGAVATYCLWVTWSAAGRLRPASRWLLSCFGFIRETDADLSLGDGA